jgi:glycosyltransferase involved in cell wall biosynthesis
MKLYISVVIPAFNEAESLPRLYTELTSVLKESGKEYEIIFVNDGSRDKTQEVSEELYSKDKKHVRVIQLRNHFGKAAALSAGFELAKGETVFQMDADLQDDPKEIPKFIKKLDEGYDMVVGWKQNRKDSFVKNQTSKIYNFATNYISRVKLHDHNCGLKAYKSEVVKSLNIYGELHRYIAVIVSAQGYKVTEVKINHRARVFGKSKYGNMRFVHGFLDLLTVFFITRFRSRPLHLFGYVGMTFFTLGLSIALYLSYIKLFGHQSIGGRSLLLLAVMLIIIGTQVSVSGLVGEQMATMMHKDNKEYVVKKVLKG